MEVWNRGFYQHLADSPIDQERFKRLCTRLRSNVGIRELISVSGERSAPYAATYVAAFKTDAGEVTMAIQVNSTPVGWLVQDHWVIFGLARSLPQAAPIRNAALVKALQEVGLEAIYDPVYGDEVTVTQLQAVAEGREQVANWTKARPPVYRWNKLEKGET